MAHRAARPRLIVALCALLGRDVGADEVADRRGRADEDDGRERHDGDAEEELDLEPLAFEAPAVEAPARASAELALDARAEVHVVVGAEAGHRLKHGAHRVELRLERRLLCQPRLKGLALGFGEPAVEVLAQGDEVFFGDRHVSCTELGCVDGARRARGRGATSRCLRRRRGSGRSRRKRAARDRGAR